MTLRFFPRKRIDNKLVILTALSFVVYKIIFDYACRHVYYIYSGSLSSMADNSKATLSWVLFSFVILFISRFVVVCDDLISFVILMEFTVNGVAFYSLYPVKNGMTMVSILLVSLFWVSFSLFSGAASRMRRKSIYDDTRMGIHSGELILFFISAVLTIAMSGLYGDFRLYISFSDVYQYRSAFLEKNVPSLFLYLIRFLSAAVLPYFFVRFLSANKRVLSFITLLLGMLMYGIDGLKTTLMLYVIILMLKLLYNCFAKRDYRFAKMMIIFVLTVSASMLWSCYYYTATGKLLYNTELYRVFVVPASIADNYYSFISENEPLYWRESILRFFFSSPYPKRLSYLLSSSGSNANTGLFGDAYANFKTFGVFLYSIMYSAVFAKWNSLINYRHAFVGIGLGFIMVWNSINLPFFTWLLTGGVILMFVLTAFFYPANNSLRHEGDGF